MTCQECNAGMERILSRFGIGRNSKLSNTSENPNEPKTIQTANQFGGAAIRIEARNCSVKNNSFQNLRTGISLDEGVSIEMSDNEFLNVKNSIEVTKE